MYLKTKKEWAIFQGHFGPISQSFYKVQVILQIANLKADELVIQDHQ